MKLARKTFAISRLSEFVTKAELIKQIGHGVTDWVEVVAKEAIDNAIDEAEEAGLTPKVEVAVDTASRTITVTDHGRGIPPVTLKAPCDLSMKVSSRSRLCLADARPAGQRAADHPCHAMRPRPRSARLRRHRRQGR